MNGIRIALLAASSLFCANLALAQQAPATAHEHPHADMMAMHKAMCGEHQATQAAHLAYLESKLQLTDAQKPLFAAWRQIVLDNAGKEQAACLGAMPKADSKPTILDREAHAEILLGAKLQSLRASKGALQALYESLTPAQRQVLDHPRHHGHWGQRHGMMMHEGGRH
jgi:hypothetical protein